MPLTSEFWEERYQDGTTRWDLGQPAPPFVTLLNAPNAPKPGRVAVLGSGRGHDALLFADRGFDVVGFDFAPSAVQEATVAARSRQLSAQFLQRDIFELENEFAASFDYVLEHTCYCAIDPSLRSDYVQVVQKILRPGGELIGLFWAHSRPEGPPFGTTLEEIKQRFTAFEPVLIMQPENSVDSRKDEEYLVRFRLKNQMD
ncbi:SAM-dependent methyltransferase [filamentous cyanobacterium CCP1]|nr:SAM-dependent methyltransferase [filamentous cyanobacterium CCP2]PSB55988.1 SAM-dependent methyltransferase [filamentous cyanobacterium CCP1]